MMGLAHSALAFLIEQLPGAKNTEKYNFKHHQVREKEEEDEGPVKPNETGCARTETYKGRKPFDMFSWLASKYRSIPKLVINNSAVPELKIQVITRTLITHTVEQKFTFRKTTTNDVITRLLKKLSLFCQVKNFF